MARLMYTLIYCTGQFNKVKLNNKEENIKEKRNGRKELELNGTIKKRNMEGTEGEKKQGFPTH